MRRDYTHGEIAWLHIFVFLICIYPLDMYYIAAIFHTHAL
ncbi:hypothetical protein VCHA42P256_110039 [Vibrio chagasii]|nr:hypothetical protein VCHA36P166_140105 [Vibrio chagasii]CAH6896914.1 hypothetical protein VCHA42P256_110039 [Vibrio chagasii]